MELKTRVAALAVLAVFFAVLGGLLFWVAASSRHPNAGLAVFGAGLVVLPLALVFLSSRRRLVIDDRRIVAKGMFGTTAIPWDDVAHYHFWSLGQQGLYVAGGGGAGVLVVLAAMAIAKAIRKSPNNRQFSMGGMKIIAKDGQAMKLDLRYKDIAPALDRCFDELHARLRDQPRDYAPFTVSASQITHAKKGALALADIEKVSVTSGRISVRKRGKRLAWATAPMSRTKNTMLFIDDLAERGIIIDAQTDVFVPLPTLSKLRASVSRQAALPSAKVVQR